jgi:hypothetical protein
MIDIGFEWTRGLAYECAPSPGDKTIRIIRQTGKRDRPFAPLSIATEKPLYLRFANLDGSSDACLGFARAWGLITLPAAMGASEKLDGWQREIKKMKSLISMLGATSDQPGGIVHTANSRRIRFKMTSLDVALLSREPGSRPALVLQPRNLLDAMHLQLAKFVATDGSVRACRQCGEWFEAGPGDARRSIAIFCTERCKNRHHYLRRIGK